MRLDSQPHIFIAVSRAISIISVNAVCLSTAVVASPVIMLSDIVRIASAFFYFQSLDNFAYCAYDEHVLKVRIIERRYLHDASQVHISISNQEVQ